MKAALYARVSSKEQEQTGYSLPAQEKGLRAYSERSGLFVAHVFSISESASGKVQRKVFTEMFARMRKDNINHLVVESTDRLTRNFIEALTADEWVNESPDRQIHIVKEGCILHKNAQSHEWFMWRVKVASAEFYVKLLSENVKKGQKEKLSQGWLPTRSPIGYKTEGDKGHKIHVIDEMQAPYVRRMYELYATGNYSIKHLADVMYEEGFRAVSGKKASKSRIEDILKNPFFYGAVPWNGELHLNGRHEPLIEKELFEKVQALRQGKTTPKYRRHQFRFKKLMNCGECGGTITGEIQKGHVYYHCNHYKSCSQKKFTREEAIEERLMGVFKFFENITASEAEQIKEKIKKDHGYEAKYKEGAMDELNTRYRALQKRLDALYDDKLDGIISGEFWEKKHKEILAQQEEMQNQITKLKSEESRYFEIGISIVDLARKAREIYSNKNWTADDRRLFLTKIFSNLVLTDGETAYTLTNSFQMIATRVQQKLDAQINFEPQKDHTKKGYKNPPSARNDALLRE